MNKHPCLKPIANQPNPWSKAEKNSSDETSTKARTFWGSIAPTLLLQIVLAVSLMILLWQPSSGGGLGPGSPGIAGLVYLVGFLFIAAFADFLLVVFTYAVSLHASRQPAPNIGYVFARGVCAVLGSGMFFAVGLAVLIGTIRLLFA